MTQRFLPKLLLAASLLACFSVYAQKPMPESPFEIKLPGNTQGSRMNGNMRVSERTGIPLAIYQGSFPLTHAAPEVMARQFLSQYKSLLGLSDYDIQHNLQIHSIRQRETGYTIRMRQLWKGIPVNKNAEITIHINKADVVDFVQNGFEYGISLSNVNPGLSAAAARQKLVNHLGLTGNPHSESNQLMLLRHLGKDYLVYRVSMATDSPVGDWEAFVNAQTGALLKVEDVSTYYRHKKHSTHQHSPRATRKLNFVNGSGQVFNPDPLSTANAAYGGSYIDNSDANAAVLTAQLQTVTLKDITLNAGTYSLVGPFAEVRDHENPKKGLFTQASSVFNFDRNNDAFEAVNCYYHIDVSMRYLNTTLGINCMPYQYTGGVRFDPHGLNGSDNSHYVSSNGSLAFGEGGVDDGEDADVIIHELGHGIHDWITSGGLSQINGLSEGCGDYWAGSYSRAKANWPSSNPAYHWTFNWDGHNPFWGGRSLNYANSFNGGLTGQIHTDGQIWASVMMKIWDDIGSQKADKAFWLGIDLTNSSSSQNDAANAVYQAATNLGYTNGERLAIYNRFVAAGYTMPPFVALSVQLIDFNAFRSGEKSQVTWKTATETRSHNFIVERSLDGSNFMGIGTVRAAGVSQVLRSYSFTDAAPMAGTNYYRLKMVNMDGDISYSKIVTVTFNKRPALTIFPNPVGDMLMLNNKFTEGELFLYDGSGKLALRLKLSSTNVNSAMGINVSTLASGMYWMRLNADGEVFEGKFYKIR